MYSINLCFSKTNSERLCTKHIRHTSQQPSSFPIRHPDKGLTDKLLLLPPILVLPLLDLLIAALVSLGRYSIEGNSWAGALTLPLLLLMTDMLYLFKLAHDYTSDYQTKRQPKPTGDRLQTPADWLVGFIGRVK